MRSLAIGVVTALALAALPAPGRAGGALAGVPVRADVPAPLCTARAQARTGFLWIAPQGGRVRYDGYQFRVFRGDAADPHALAGSYVRTLLPAADGRLWVGTFASGLAVSDPAAGGGRG